jgi:hypothetical protein
MKKELPMRKKKIIIRGVALMIALTVLLVGGCVLSRQEAAQRTTTVTRITHQSVPASSLVPLALAQGNGVELTVYNQNIALVRDIRSFELEQGVNEVRFSDVASQIDATSVHFRSLTDPNGTAVLEQNYEYDIVGSQKLLQKYVDQKIQLMTDDGSEYSGTLLSGAGDIILQDDSGGVTVIRLDQVQQFDFPALPEGLITRPTLVWLLDAGQSGDQDVEVTYMTSGVNWRADYVVQLNQDDTALDLNGWITLDNRSGATYNEAKLKLVAGDVNVVREARADAERMMVEAEMPAPTVAPGVQEREFFEYHLYDVQRPVTVRDNQTKQIEFASAADVPAEKFFVYDGARGLGFYGYVVTDPGYGVYSNPDVNIYLQIENEEEAGLGIPLPAGRVRVYKADIDGSLQFVGEDRIDHTPKDETVRLLLGNAFDVVGERRQTDFRELGRDVIEESFEIVVRNHKDEDIEVRVVEHLFRWSEWEIVQESSKHTKLDQGTAEWRLRIPVDGEATLTYTVRYEF